MANISEGEVVKVGEVVQVIKVEAREDSLIYVDILDDLDLLDNPYLLN